MPCLQKQSASTHESHHSKFSTISSASASSEHGEHIDVSPIKTEVQSEAMTAFIPIYNFVPLQEEDAGLTYILEMYFCMNFTVIIN